MGNQYIGEIRMVGFSFAPKGWALCNGQTMQINQNQPLFALLGIVYGGNGVQTFQLPNFQGRTSIGTGAQPSGPTFAQGQMGGEEQHVLQANEMPSHTHTATASSAANTVSSPSGNFWASGIQQYASPPCNVGMAAQAIPNAGGGQGHENRSPYQVVNFIIALTGIFPSRN